MRPKDSQKPPYIENAASSFRQPAAVPNRAGRLTSRTKRVSGSKLPHAREELAKASNAHGHAYNNVGLKIHLSNHSSLNRGIHTTLMSLAPALYNDRMSVVDANPNNPRGAGFASLRW